MTLTEKAAYLRGLYDGLGLKESEGAEARLLSAVIDVVEELAGHVTENEESITTLADQMDELNETVDGISELLSEGLEALDEDEDGEDEVELEVECPKCAAPIVIDEEALSGGEVTCAACGQRFSIDVGYEDEDTEGQEELSF